MSTEIEPEVTEVPVPAPVERGRYAIYLDRFGLSIARATGICESCATCGCGEQQEPLNTASMLKMGMDMAREQGNGKAAKLLGMLGKVSGHG